MENCKHEGCGCQVESGQEFCGDFCREHMASGPTGEACGCGHADCQAA